MKILFVAFNNDTQLKTFLPVMELLRESNGAECLLVSGCELKGMHTDRKLLTSSGIPYEVLDSRVNDRRFNQLLRSVTVARRRIARVLDEHRPSVVVLGNDHTVPHNYLLGETRRREIPTLLVQDGVMRPAPAVLPCLKRLAKSFARIPLSYGQGNCTRIAAWGQRARNYFLAAGCSPDSIDVVGCPRFDRILADPPSRNHSDGLLPPASRRILYLSSAELKFGLFSSEERRTTLLAMLGAPKALEDACPGTRLVIKLHRADDITSVRELVRACGAGDKCTLLQNEIDLYALLPLCDVAVTYCSTAGLEALLFKKPLIIFNPTGRPDPIDYVPGDAALPAQTEGEIHTLLRDILTNPQFSAEFVKKAREYLTSQVGSLDGQATFRVAKSIIALGSGQHKLDQTIQLAGFLDPAEQFGTEEHSGKGGRTTARL